MGKARDGENSVVYDTVNDNNDALRKSIGGPLLRQSIARMEDLSMDPSAIQKAEDAFQALPELDIRQSIAAESSICSVIDLKINNGVYSNGSNKQEHE